MNALCFTEDLRRTALYQPQERLSAQCRSFGGGKRSDVRLERIIHLAQLSYCLVDCQLVFVHRARYLTQLRATSRAQARLYTNVVPNCANAVPRLTGAAGETL